jgi:hypothetical protein
MKHIRYKLDSSKKQEVVYTVVITDGWTRPLEEHPSIVEHPEFFEIVDSDIPSNVEYLTYQSS